MSDRSFFNALAWVVAAAALLTTVTLFDSLQKWYSETISLPETVLDRHS